MGHYISKRNALIKQADYALRTENDYTKAAELYRQSFDVFLEACLKYVGKKPSSTHKSIRKLIKSVKNKEPRDSLAIAGKYILSLDNPTYHTKEHLEATRDSLLDNNYYFCDILESVDKGGTLFKSRFKNGIIDGKTSVFYMSVIVLITAILSMGVILLCSGIKNVKEINLAASIVVFISIFLLDFAAMHYQETVPLAVFTSVISVLAYKTFSSMPMAILFSSGIMILTTGIDKIIYILKALYFTASVTVKIILIINVLFNIIHISTKNMPVLLVSTGIPCLIVIVAAAIMQQKKHKTDGSLFKGIQLFYKWQAILIGLLFSAIPLYPYRKELTNGLLIASKDAADNVYSFALSHIILSIIIIKILLFIFRNRRR